MPIDTASLLWVEAIPLRKTCGKSYQKVVVIRLYLCLVRRLVSYRLAAFVTAVNYDITLFGVGSGLYRAQNAAAIVCSVTGVYINVKRAEAKRTVIS